MEAFCKALTRSKQIFMLTLEMVVFKEKTLKNLIKTLDSLRISKLKSLLLKRATVCIDVHQIRLINTLMKVRFLLPIYPQLIKLQQQRPNHKVE